MGKTKDKIFIPVYRMERNGFYLLLRVQMEKRGSKNINGVGKEFLRLRHIKMAKKFLQT